MVYGIIVGSNPADPIKLRIGIQVFSDMHNHLVS
jgi:hypothetical protein